MKAMTLTAALALVLICIARAPAANVVAEWKFDEGQGQTARDSTGNGHDGTLKGVTWVRDGEGFAVRFDGASSMIECKTSEKLHLKKAITLEAWVKPIATGWGECHLIGYSSSQYMLNYSTRGMTWWLVNTGHYHLGSKLLRGQWNHIVATADGKSRSLFVNGRLVGTRDTTLPTVHEGRFIMGADEAPCYNGLLDNVRVYDGALSPAEVTARYVEQAGKHGIDPDAIGRVRSRIFEYARDGKVVAQVDYTGVQPLTGAGRVDVRIARPDDPSKVLAGEKLDSLPAHGRVDVELNTADLPAGEYVALVTVSDDRLAQPVESIKFNYAPAALPADPATAVVPKVSPPAGPAPFNVELADGGGFQVVVNGVAYPFESRISWPNGDFNHLSNGPSATGEKAWKVNVTERSPTRMRVEAGGEYYAVNREITVRDNHVYVKDTYTNRGNDDLGLMLYNQTPLSNRQITAKRLAGYEGGGRMIDGVHPHTGGASVFVQDQNAGMGFLPLDDVFCIQSVIWIDNETAGIGTEKFALAPGASYTLEWQVYPLGATATAAAGDYWDFINAFRKSEGRYSTVQGNASFISYGPMNRRQVPDEGFVKNRNLQVGIISCLSRSADDPEISIEGFEFVDFPREMELTKQQAMAIRQKYPGMKVVVHNAHTLYATNQPDRFADSKLVGPDGTQRASGGPPAMSRRRSDEGWAWYVYYPTPGNSFHDAMMQSVDVMMDEMGLDGAFVDGFLMGYGGRWTYDRWDGHSAEIDPKTKTIQRKVGSVLLLMQPSMIEYARKIRDKGGICIANGSVITRSIANEKYIMFDAESEAGPECHLAPNAQSLALGPFETEQDIYFDVLDKLRWGVLYMYYNDRIPLTYASLPASQYPITFEEMRSGLVRGKERIITMNSGVYGWPRDASLHAVHLFDARGALSTNRFTTTVDSDGARTKLEFAENESAVVQRIPALIKAAAPVNVIVTHYDTKSLRMRLNGRGDATLEFFVGSPYPDRRDGVFFDGGVNPADVNYGAAFDVTINGVTSRIEERDGRLQIPLKLGGATQLSVAPAGGK